MNLTQRVHSLLRIAVVFAAICLLHCSSAFAADDVNAVLGNVSWLATHQGAPSTGSEVERIQTHLRYVAALLEQDSKSLTTSQTAARTDLIRALRDYAEAGVFPRRSADDGYGRRRPRFIDDRGVHCAVGELIRVSGDPALAQTINAQWEFSFVPEIAAPALVLWAEIHGFTVQELAMIQPSYSAPPSEASVLDDAQDARDALTLQCAKKHTPPAEIKLHFRGDEHGNVTVKARGKNAFATCFATALQATGLGSGGAWDQQPKSFNASLKMSIQSPQELVAHRLKRLDLGGASSRCVPRPGPIVRKALVELTATSAPMVVGVKTEPSNPEVTACLEERVRGAFADVGSGNWKIHVIAEKTIGPVVTSARLQQVVPYYASAAATKCYDDSTPAKLGVTVAADPDDEEFAIRLTGGSEAFQACVSEDLRERLRSDLAAPRKMGPEKYERYFRIDGPAKFEATVDVETPGQMMLREKKQREELERSRDLY